MSAPRRWPRSAGWALAGSLLATLATSRGQAEVAPSAGDASAAPVAADDLIARGVALRREGRDHEALPLFEAAYAQVRTPRAAAQLGFVEQALGLWVNAESHLFEAITANGDPWIQRNADLIEESLTLAHTHVGLLRVDVDVAGAEIFVDARPVGHAPLIAAIGVATGDRRVEARAAGYQSHVTTVAVTAGQTAKVMARLQPASPAAGPQAASRLALRPPSSPAGGAREITARDADATAGGSDTPGGPIYKRWWFWTGAGVLLAGTALAFSLSGAPASYPCGGGGRLCAR